MNKNDLLMHLDPRRDENCKFSEFEEIEDCDLRLRSSVSRKHANHIKQKAEEQIRDRARLATMNRIINTLKRRVECVEKQLASTSSANNTIDRIQELIELTRSVFPGGVTVENSIDPEYPETIDTVFKVNLSNKSLSIDDIMDLEEVWYQKVGDLLPGFVHKVRILVA